MKQFHVFMQMERKPIMVWAIGSASYVALMGLMFMAIGGSEGMEELAESYPQEILDALGIDELGSPLGFVSAQFASVAPVVFGIFLVMFMTKHLAGAEESGVIDHVLARPVSRTTYYWHLAASGAAGYGVILGVTAIGGVVGILAEASGRELAGMVGLNLEMLPLGLVFLGLGGLLGSAFHHRALANGIGAGIVVLSYALDVGSRTADGMSWLAYLTPMGYLSRSDLAHGDLDLLYVAVSLIVAAALAVAGWQIHERKQLFS